MYYFKHTRCRAAICLLGALTLVRLCPKQALFEEVLSAADMLPLLKSHGIFIAYFIHKNQRRRLKEGYMKSPAERLGKYEKAKWGNL